MIKQALIVQGGWDGHFPKGLSELFDATLRQMGFDVEVSDTLNAFREKDLKTLDLIVPIWTMGHITGDQCAPVMDAVQSGVGLAGCHGGMCDAFRENCDWQFLTGGQFVSHPGGGDTHYRVHIVKGSSSIVDGIEDFDVTSEQYYMHVDPANKVLATTVAPMADGPWASNGQVAMPVVWTRLWGKGRVFYNSLGHDPAIMGEEHALTLMRQGFAWAAEGKKSV